jgi:hypothetical protein
MSQYGPGRYAIDIGREPFIPPPIFQAQIDALIDDGYLVRPEHPSVGQIGSPLRCRLRVRDAPAVIIPDEARAQVEDLIRSGERLAAATAIRHIAKVGWTQAHAHVDELERALMGAEHCWVDPRSPITLSHDVLERANRLVQDRNPISAMALIRAETGASLLECRTYVDDLVRKSRRSS